MVGRTCEGRVVVTWEPPRANRMRPSDSLGPRIARLRAERGWTQQQLADRVGISRVAVSHLENDINVPGERTVALLAGCFRLEPHELVADTTYPPAKADRLPLVAARWTEVEHRLALLDRDLWWLEQVGGASAVDVAELVGSWRIRLGEMAGACFDQAERTEIDAAIARLEGVVARHG